MNSDRIKRLSDIVFASGGLFLLSPLLLIISIILEFTLSGPIFFRQLRPGISGSPFALIKFRTMADLRDNNGELMPDAVRLTPIGRFLRSTSLDELPELYNVLKGDMSLVGPRPLLMSYLDRYTSEQSRRHEVKPGLTGWAQINGRNAISWEDKFNLDIWYVDNQSLRLDLKIIALTFKKVIRREGINHEGEATMSEFLGSEGR